MPRGRLRPESPLRMPMSPEHSSNAMDNGDSRRLSPTRPSVSRTQLLHHLRDMSDMSPAQSPARHGFDNGKQQPCKASRFNGPSSRTSGWKSPLPAAWRTNPAAKGTRQERCGMLAAITPVPASDS
ncbi:uncharacterized protein UV8b_04912 [Ustilaginoidea virens]|uniref:Uncharacterized protein n=1 Tax=Ustilaginoidea virens TaxID=1159556 RepID=A0A8E5MI55_USTVR|nr:uncharacterized protein UV8b_04912 [Ustilaginoidea virens]QUC20671.1 hypothetical protein UV8b_04912 [Ustilaginoidea virens]